MTITTALYVTCLNGSWRIFAEEPYKEVGAIYTNKHDAYLHAASPDLYAAMEPVEDAIKHQEKMNTVVIKVELSRDEADKIIKAMKKARGEL